MRCAFPPHSLYTLFILIWWCRNAFPVERDRRLDDSAYSSSSFSNFHLLANGRQRNGPGNGQTSVYTMHTVTYKMQFDVMQNVVALFFSVPSQNSSDCHFKKGNFVYSVFFHNDTRVTSVRVKWVNFMHEHEHDRNNTTNNRHKKGLHFHSKYITSSL